MIRLPFATRITRALLTALLGVALSGSTAVVVAQTPEAISLKRATRPELASRIASLEGQVAGGSVQGKKKEVLVAEIADIRARLTNGDFKVGDRFYFTLTIDSVSSDTISVRDGLLVTVVNLPDASLKGVLQSELDDVLLTHVSRYVKNARLRTVMLTQISVIGSVGRPGYYWTTPDRPLGDVIMMAGGPAVDANLREVEIKRDNRVIMKAKASRQALSDGRTLEQVDVRSGDEIRVPGKRKLNWQVIIQLLFVASSLFFAFIRLLQWYYAE
ncbi:MAG: SLBB domain-containing protein [Gemmatimonas sp.]